MLRKVLGLPGRVLRKIVSLAGRKADEAPPVRPAPARPAPRPRVVEEEEEEADHGHSHSHGHSHDHGRAPEPAPKPAPKPAPAPEPEAHGHSHGHSHSHGSGHAASVVPVLPPLSVSPEQTPNPNAMKFAVSRKVSPKGSFSFNSAAEAESHKLGKALFAVSGVAGVFGVNDFVTVTKDDAASWDSLLTPISDALKANL